MFNHAIKGEVPLRNPISKTAAKVLREDNEQTRVLTYDEQEKYLEKATPMLWDVATLMLETGMRPEEVYRIQTANVYLTENYLFNPYGKTKAAKRRIKLTETAKSILTLRMKAAAERAAKDKDSGGFPLSLRDGRHATTPRHSERPRTGFARKQSGSVSSLRLSPYLGYPRSRSRNRPRDSGSDARPLQDQYGSPLRPSDARASDEGNGQDGAVCQRTEDCPCGANSAANVLRRSIGAEQSREHRKARHSLHFPLQ